MNRPRLLIPLAVFGLLWLLVLPRFLSLLLFATFIVSALLPPTRRIPYVCVTLFALTLAASWSPLDVSFLKVAGGPKILECCPGAPYRDPGEAAQKQSRGECMFCGDLMPPNGIPRWYLVL
jgi:hypothetical protein